MSDLSGMTREHCAAGCSLAGCVILGSLQPRCAHPIKGGPPIHLLNDTAAMTAFSHACAAIGVGNVYSEEKSS